MPSPFQASTAAAATGLAYAPQRKLEALCDGSYLSLVQTAVGTLKLVQVTTPGGTPTFTTLTQTFSVSGGSNTTGDLFILNNGTTTSDVWLAYADNSTTTGLFVAHGTYTASGATWSWDNTGTSIALGSFTGGFMLPSIVWTGSTLIVATRGNVINYSIALTYTTTKNGSSGWAALFSLAGGSDSSHDYPLLAHDDVNGCTLVVYTRAGDTLNASVLADTSTPALANWSAPVALTGTVNVGAANLAATLDTANKRLHVLYNDSGGSLNPHYVSATYTTTTITPGTPFSVSTAVTTAAGVAIGLTSGGIVYLFWSTAAAGSAADISYASLASPYASGNLSAVTNLTNNTTTDNAYPHVPARVPLSGSYVPLLYAHAKSPWAVEYDNSIALPATTHTLGVSAQAHYATRIAAQGVTARSAFRVQLALPSLATAASVTYRAAVALVARARGAFLVNGPTAGTGIGDLAVTTPTVSWSGGPGGSPGTATRVTYVDGTNSGDALDLIPTYGGMPIADLFSVDAGTLTEEASLSTSQPGGHIHILEQTDANGFGGSEDPTFTLTELAPTGTPFRRYYRTVAVANDVCGMAWSATAAIYPGDPGLIAYRFDMHNPSGASITLSGTDGIEIALIGSLEQADTTWAPANGGYGTLAGSNHVGWPSALTSIEPDYVYITPASGGNTNLGQATVKKTSLIGLGWSNLQIQYLQNSSRLKLKVQSDGLTIAAGATQTVYLLQVLRRNLTASDVRAIAADYLTPGAPTTTAGSFTSYSYDERAFVYAAQSGGSALVTTFDLSSVSIRYKPIVKITGWTSSAAPRLTWGGAALTAGVDYRWVYDAAGQTLYLQLYFDLVASGATTGQRANAALSVQGLRGLRASLRTRQQIAAGAGVSTHARYAIRAALAETAHTRSLTRAALVGQARTRFAARISALGSVQRARFATRLAALGAAQRARFQTRATVGAVLRSAFATRTTLGGSARSVWWARTAFSQAARATFHVQSLLTSLAVAARTHVTTRAALRAAGSAQFQARHPLVSGSRARFALRIRLALSARAHAVIRISRLAAAAHSVFPLQMALRVVQQTRSRIFGAFRQAARATFLMKALGQGWRGPGVGSATTVSDAAEVSATARAAAGVTATRQDAAEITATQEP